MSQTTYEILQNAMHYSDAKCFFSILESLNLPFDNWHDYELLVEAIKSGLKSIVHQLLDKGCRVTKPKAAESPLHLVVQKLKGWSNVVEKLIQRGARVSDVDANGNTPLHLAFLNGALDYTIDLLLENFVRETSRNLRNNDGLSVLHIACTRLNPKIVRILAEDNISCQVLSNSDSMYAGCSPLHFAVWYGGYEIVELLLEHNANIYAHDANNSTPLHLALYRRDVNMIDLILSYDKQKWDCVDNMGLSHFMAACVGNNTIIAEEFLRQSTSPMSLINARVDDLAEVPYAGYSPLHFAADFQRFSAVQMLVNYGARYVSTRNKKLTPMMLAVKNNDETTCHILREHYGYACQ